MCVIALTEQICSSLYYSQSDSAVEFHVNNSSPSSSSDDEDTNNGTPDVNGDDNTSDDGKILYSININVAVSERIPYVSANLKMRRVNVTKFYVTFKCLVCNEGK